MKEVLLGDSDERVSSLALGCMYFGSTTNKAISYRLLDMYLEAGGRFLDTANNYAFWVQGCTGDESETLLGAWMAERGNRKEVFLATKCGGRPKHPGGGLDAREGLAPQAIAKAIDDSLRRLRTDYVDLYYAHVTDAMTPLEATMEAFDKLVRNGKVRHIGCSNHHSWRLAVARRISDEHGWAKYCCIQQRHSYLRPQPGSRFVEGIQIHVHDDLLDYCKVEGLPIVAYSPLLSGCYTRRDRPIPPEYASTDTDARLSALEEVSEQTGATRNQVVLAWMMSSVPVVIPITAAGTEVQLRENLGCLDVALSEDQMRRLDNAGPR